MLACRPMSFPTWLPLLTHILTLTILCRCLTTCTRRVSCSHTLPCAFDRQLGVFSTTCIQMHAGVVTQIASSARVPSVSFPLQSAPSGSSSNAEQVLIGVARDAAFSFYYHEYVLSNQVWHRLCCSITCRSVLTDHNWTHSNLRLLEEAGARLEFFSPLADSLPAGISGLYLGGGYPERHAEALAANRQLRAAVRAFADAGGVIYAECGGMIYLSHSLQLVDGLPADMGASIGRRCPSYTLLRFPSL